MAVYGDTLNSFPELFQNLHAWEGTPKAGGGYNIGQEVEVSGILLNSTGSSFHRTWYGGDYVLDLEKEDLLWVRESAPIKLGMFFYHPENGTVQRVVKELDRSRAGGFKRFVVERVQGANGTNEDSRPISEGVYL